MKVFLILLEEAENLDFENFISTDKNDMMVFLYSNEKDNISISLFNKLSEIKIKTEFKHIDNNDNLLAIYAFLSGFYTGQNYTVVSITSNKNFEILNSHIKVFSLFKEYNKIIEKENKEIKKERKPRESRKPRVPKKEKITEGTKEPETVIQIENENTLEDNVINETEKISENSFSRKEFKNYLTQFDTKELTLSSYASSIAIGVKQAIKNNLSIKECLSEILTSKKTVEKVDEILKDHYEEILELFKN